MFTYNNNHIFTGYIKELLANSPLPNYYIYKNDEETFTSHVSSKKVPACWYNLYLKDDKLQCYCWNDDDDIETPEYEWKEVADIFNIPQDQRASFYAKTKTLNNSKKLTLKNNIYDVETHNFLGEYLRYQRDWNNLNLMPLYNCFTDDICLKANFEFTINSNIIKINTLKDQDQYKVYKIPIKFFKKYTIAMDSAQGAELVCGFFNQYQMASQGLTDNFYGLTYKKYNSLKFNSPVVYDKLAKPHSENEPLRILEQLSINSTPTDYINYMGMLDNLTLFIKVPININSSIVILEGDYTGFNNNFWESRGTLKSKLIDISATGNTTYSGFSAQSVLTKTFNDLEAKNQASETMPVSALGQSNSSYSSISGTETTRKSYAKIMAEQPVTKYTIINRQTNHWVTNYDIYNSSTLVSTRADTTIFKPITNLQLLEANTLKSRPFSDRLIEYLSENAIGPLETEIPENIERVKKVILQNREAVLDKTKSTSESPVYKDTNMWALQYPNLGAWEEKMQRILYDYMQTENLKNRQQSYSASRDGLGFVDKDTELNYASFKPQRNINNQIITKDDEPIFEQISSLGSVE